MMPVKGHPWRKAVVSEKERAMRERWRGYKANQRGRDAARLAEIMGALGGTGGRSRRRLKPWARLAPTVREKRARAWSRRVMYELAEAVHVLREEQKTLSDFVDGRDDQLQELQRRMVALELAIGRIIKYMGKADTDGTMEKGNTDG